MTSPLLPTLNGSKLTVEAALKQPSKISARIAKLADSQILLPRFFRQLGAPVQGGGMLYSALKPSDFYTSGDVEQRAPGGEYKVVEGIEPEPRLATVEDWGAKAQILDEYVRRNDTNRMDLTTTQLANELARKLDTRTVEALLAADGIESIPVANPWDNLQFVGPDSGLTPSTDRPSAHLAQALELGELSEMNPAFDTLVLHPTQLRALREAYGETLGAMLDALGLKPYSNVRVPEGTAFVCEGGGVGTVGWEQPLNTEVYDERATRSRWIQTSAMPAFGVDRPYACVRLTGLSTP